MRTTIPVATLQKFTTFGDMLRFLRRRVGITQMELAIAVGYSDAQISRLEQNLRLPDIPTIEARFVSALDLENELLAIARLLELAANVRREDAPAFGPSPYKGLAYFDENDADLFIGREALTARLTERVLDLAARGGSESPRLFAIIGASGSGKSSLARAGLVPSLRWNEAAGDWKIHILTPTVGPLESLAMELTRGSPLHAAATLMDDLRREPRSLHLFSRRSVRTDNASRLLLLVDQFEELFALCRSEAERLAFIDNLTTAACEPDGLTIVVLTLRADFYAHCAAYPNLRDALAKNQEYIGAINPEELRRVIEEPARLGRWELEAGLVDLLLHDVGQEPGALPLLSHALLETWQRRRGHTLTLSGYTASGGVRGAIAETAEAVFTDKFSRDQQAIARRIFLRLTEFGDEESAGDTRRRASLSELSLKAGDAAAIDPVLKELADARLITVTEDAADVAHEALIREWPRLRDWLRDNREGLRLHRQLSEAAHDWATLQREPDALYRGARLIQAREWAASNASEMNELEREFLAASIEAAEYEITEKEKRRQRELDAAQNLARAEQARVEEQASSIKRLRQRGILLVSALVLALFAAILAGVFARNARQQALISSVRELSSAANLNLEIDPERSILLALQAVNKTYAIDHTALPEAEDALHRAVQSSRVELTLYGHADSVWSAVFSPDGTRIATASADGTAKIWDATTGKERLTVKGSTFGIVWYAAFSPDGRLLATAGEDSIARIWDATTGEELFELSGHTEDVYHIEFSPDGSRLVTISVDGTARTWDARTGKELLTLSEEGGAPQWFAFSPDGSRIAIAYLAGNSEGWTTIWDVVTGQKMLTLSGQNSWMRSVAFSPDGTRIVTTSDDRRARIWDAQTGKELLTFYNHTDFYTNAAYTPDGTRIATAIGDGQVIVWDAATGQELLTLAGHSRIINTIAFSPDGTRVVTASGDKTARVWSVTPAREFLTLENGPVIVSVVGAKLAYSPDGTRLAVAYADPIAKVWDMTTGKLFLSLSGHTASVNFIAYNFDGTRIATADSDGTTKVWNADSGKVLLTLAVPGDFIVGVAFSPDGSRLATTSFDGTAKVWDATTGKKLLTLVGHTDRLFSVAFSPDGSRIATSGADFTAIVWDAVTGKELFPLTGHSDNVRGVVFSPDGTRLATASLDGTAKLWDAVSGRELLTLSGHTGSVFAIAFSPDGKYIVTASGDKTARLWDAFTGQELLTLHAPDGLTSVAFSPDGSQLATASRDGTDRIYLLKIEDLVALARQRVTRSLTTDECQQYLHVAACPPEP